MRKKVVAFLSVLLTLTIALSGCSGEKADESSKIIVGIPQDLEDSLDPQKAVAAGTKEVLFNMYEGLLKPDSKGNIIPAVAEKYEISDDGKVYTFTLRDQVKFHDGNPVTAEDVEYSIKKAAGMTGEEPLIAAFSSIKEVNVVSDKTVEIVLDEQNVDFPAYIANTNACIIPKDNPTPDTNPIGTGPYKYVSRSPQENIIMERFDDYWGEKGEIEQVIFKVEANADTIVMDLKGGSIDMSIHLTSTQVAGLGEGFDVYEGAMNLVQALYLNNKVEPFDDIRVRQAMCYAVDVQGMLDLTSDGKGSIVGSSMYPAFEKYFLPELTTMYPHNIEMAKSLLAEAGYENGFDMTITVPSNYQPHIDTAQVLVEQLSKVGINATIQLVEWNTWLSDVYTNRNYSSTVIGVDASSMTANAMLERFYSKEDGNFINFSDEEYDKLYLEALKTMDDEKQTSIYKRLETILAEKAANVYLQDMAEFVAIRDKYEGYAFYPMYILDISKLKIK